VRGAEDTRWFTILVSGACCKARRRPSSDTHAQPDWVSPSSMKGSPVEELRQTPVVEPSNKDWLRVERAENRLALRCVVMTAFL
jgi:hypothetical protein